MSPARRLAAVAVTSTLALTALGSSLPGDLAQALPGATDFVLESPELAATAAGQRLELRVTAGEGTIDCKTIKLEQATPAGWKDLPHNAFASGCWTGGVSLVSTVQPGMAGQRVRLVGRIGGETTEPIGRVKVGTDDAMTQPVVLSQALESSDQTGLGFVATSADITAEQVGKPVSLRATVSGGGVIDCNTVQVQRQLANGNWSRVPIQWGPSGCWNGGSLQVVTATQAMVGQPLRITGALQALDDATPKLTAEFGAADATTPVKVTVNHAAPTEVVADKAPAAGNQSPADGTDPVPGKVAPTPVETTKPATPNLGAAGDVTSLDLPRIPWEGGAAYYSKFPDAVRGGWSDPNHFPIMLWWGGVSTDAEVKADKALGINTYVVLNKATDYRLLGRNGVSYIGNQLDGQPRNDSAWVGDYLDDEVDGRMGPAEGASLLQRLSGDLPDHNKIRYANYTGMVISWFANNPTWNAASNKYVRDYTDAVSLDAYWYSSDQCEWSDPRGWAFAMPFTKASCRTGQNYGRNAGSLVWRTQQAGKPQPVYNFIENVDIAVEGYTRQAPTPDEVKGAAMSTLIHEGRGLIWFNQSFGGKCSTGNAVRSYQNPNYPCRDTITAMGEVNNLALSLAPVLNTQSYKWDFGKDLHTMLKVQGGNAYVFAMSDDSSTPGNRTFTLPPQLRGGTISVVGENRTIKANADGTFTDNFRTVNSYHVYKIS